MTVQTTPNPVLPSGCWRLDRSATTLTATATKFGFYRVPATIDIAQGTIEIDEDHQLSIVDVTADAGSYTSRSKKRDAIIRGSDFLDADHHPTIAFQGDTATPTATGYQAAGTISMRGRSLPIELQITDLAITADTATFTASGQISRTALGLDKLPKAVVGDRVQLTISATAQQRP